MAAHAKNVDKDTAPMVEFERETAVTLCEGESIHGELGITEHKFNKLEERINIGNGVSGITSVGFDRSVLQEDEEEVPTDESKEKKRIAPDLVLACEPSHPKIVSLNETRSSSRSSLPGGMRVALEKAQAQSQVDARSERPEQRDTPGVNELENSNRQGENLNDNSGYMKHRRSTSNSNGLADSFVQDSNVARIVVEASNQSLSRGVEFESIRDSEDSETSNQFPSNMKMAPVSRKRKHFTTMEDAMILKSVEEHGKNWTAIAGTGKIDRNAGQIRKRYKVLQRKEQSKSLGSRVANELLNRNNSNGALFGGSTTNSSTPGSATRGDGDEVSSPMRSSSTRDSATLSSPTPYVRPSNQPVIQNFFLPISSTKQKRERKQVPAGLKSPKSMGGNSSAQGSVQQEAVSEPKPTSELFEVSPPPTTLGSNQNGTFQSKELSSKIKSLQVELEVSKDETDQLRKDLTMEKNKNENLIATLTLEKDECANLSKELERVNTESRTHRGRAAKLFETYLREMDKKNSLLERQKFMEESFRLGKVVIQKHGVGPRAKLQEVWEDGHSFRALRKRQLVLLQQREALDKRKRQLTRSRARVKNKTNSDSQNQVMGPPSTDVVDESIDLEVLEAEEAVKVQMMNFKREEIRLAEEKNRLDVEKVMHMRSLKRIRDEDSSRFNKHPVLNNRYLLRNLLGKGGFSEVWKAFDLMELKDVAVKIHELNPAWAEIKKSSYLKHATREYKIHLNLVHPRIVQLYDVFEIDSSSFATVLEYCEGTDLDLHLKRNKVLPEREARCLLIQILSGLRYLHAGGEFGQDEEGDGNLVPTRRRIIHYDLKPGNILFDENGMVKITDFGLSKIVETDSSSDVSAIDLTSQGAGTYWYLPPECFRVGQQPPKISSKVDVWSVGVIFYQMLFGRRPFGEGQSQDKILQNMTMLRATEVEFPAKPVVSKESREFIRQCLTHDQSRRPDVQKLCKSPYLRVKRV